jgi:hypothetical protein
MTRSTFDLTMSAAGAHGARWTERPHHLTIEIIQIFPLARHRV